MAKIELPKSGQVVRVAAPHNGYRRAGVAHTKEPVDHAHDAFTAAQLEQLHADPRIRISYVDVPKAPGPQESNKPTDKGK